jgi:hypothetical protein
MAIMMTTKLHMMLKVNKKSNNSGGSGNTNMAMMTSTTTGILSPLRSNFDKFCRIVDRVSVLICEIQLKVERLGFFLPGNDFVGKYIKQSMCQPKLTP